MQSTLRWDCVNWTRVHVSLNNCVKELHMRILTSHGPADLVALDSSPNARFPRGRNLHGLAGRIQMPDYGMPWSLKDFPKGPWIDKLNCLTKTFMAAVSDKSRDFAFDLTFGARPTLNIQQPSESLWGPERVMESRIQMLMQFSWHFAWAENVAFLRRKLEHQRYEALLSPSAATYRPLITLRRAIAGTRSGIVALQNSIQPGMEEAFQRMHGDSERTLRGMYEPLLKQIDDINRELNEDIQLIIGAVTIQDSEAMKLQAERATLLTLLAAIYLPLTLVTGIFGMNIQEINGGIPSFKACLEALAVAAVITGIFVFSYSCWRRWRKTQEQQRQEQEVTEHRDLAALFERRSGHPREDGSVKFGTVVKVLKRGWERTKDALSRMVRRKRQASPGASNELGERG